MMSTRISCIVVLAIMFNSAIVAESAVQNIKAGGDITSFVFYRNNYDLNSSDALDNNLGLFSTIARLNISADLTEKIETYILISNERDWDIESSSSTNLELDYAYIMFKEMFDPSLTLTIGRQEMVFGNAMVVANSGQCITSLTADDYSARNAFDAIRATLNHEPLIVDLVYSKIDEVNEADDEEDEDLYGINIGYQFANYDAVAEGYLFVKDSDAKDIYTIGTRSDISLLDGLELGAEVAYQFGDYSTIASASRSQKSWAVEVLGAYTFDNEYHTSLRSGYYYRSGNKASKTTGNYEGWDPMYEDQVLGRIYDALFAGLNGGCNSNVHIINAGFSINPTEDISLNIDYYHYVLDEKFVSGAHPVNSDYAVTNKDDVGDEIDVVTEYAYSEDVTFGLEFNWFLPGDMFAHANSNTASQMIGYVAVEF
ncbi:MAG: alginate export family protein [Candidatus Saelkia tenebricola]|nr:alginate export family protein [Candidatus Saelkia tenebricola]